MWSSECIGKGKASAPYEIGVKASIVTNIRRASGALFVLHARALPDTPTTVTPLGQFLIRLWRAFVPWLRSFPLLNGRLYGFLSIEQGFPSHSASFTDEKSLHRSNLRNETAQQSFLVFGRCQ